MDRYPLEMPGFTDPNPEWTAVETPFDRGVIAEVQIAPTAALDQALAVARKTQDTSWKKTPAWKRAEIVRNVAGQIRSRHEELAMLIASEGGKPLTDARVEATRAAVTLEECAAVAERLEGRQWSMQRAPGSESKLAFTIPEPIGVVLAISAFNHPLNLVCHQAGAAIAAGNTCVLKPATSTPISAIELMRMFRKAGLPEEVLQTVVCSGKAASRMVESDLVDFITFIGSKKVGWGIRRAMADGTRMAAEHGGQAASIVLDDADLDHTIARILKGGYYHAGQVCVSTQRLYVTKGIESRFTEKLVTGAKKLVEGDARDADTDVGALIETSEVTRVKEWVDEAKAGGAEVLLGGEARSKTLYGTTVLRGAADDSKVIQDEIFGPVVVVQPVESLDEAIARVNASRDPFQASIFTQDIDDAFRAAREVEAAAFMVNELTAFRVDWMPFGGRKEAGLGLGGVEHGIHDMTEEKLIVIETR
ncbi:MAG: aldehyde dehydrogenase [Acidimicrobiales bacterium]|nr:MAG: aldehyde dehydrogenase [Acidimicrobiales bacterium]